MQIPLSLWDKSRRKIRDFFVLEDLTQVKNKYAIPLSLGVRSCMYIPLMRNPRTVPSGFELSDYITNPSKSLWSGSHDRKAGLQSVHMLGIRGLKPCTSHLRSLDRRVFFCSSDAKHGQNDYLTDDLQI